MSGCPVWQKVCCACLPWRSPGVGPHDHPTPIMCRTGKNGRRPRLKEPCRRPLRWPHRLPRPLRLRFRSLRWRKSGSQFPHGSPCRVGAGPTAFPPRYGWQRLRLEFTKFVRKAAAYYCCEPAVNSSSGMGWSCTWDSRRSLRMGNLFSTRWTSIKRFSHCSTAAAVQPFPRSRCL